MGSREDEASALIFIPHLLKDSPERQFQPLIHRKNLAAGSLRVAGLVTTSRSWYIADVIPTIREKYPKMIIMVVSGYYTEELVQCWKKLGADDTLPMPFRLEVLVERLESLLTEE